MSLPNPPCGVIAHPAASRAFVSPDQPGGCPNAMQVIPFRDALETQWPTDAHFTLYSLSPHEKQWPRLAKRSLSYLKSAGSPATLQIVALDFDDPSTHGPGRQPGVHFSEQSYHDLLDRLASLALTRPHLVPNLTYRSRGGARLVYLLSEPVEPAHGEQIHKNLVIRLAEALGIVCDQNVWDWTRLSRLPNVERDGKTLRSPITELSSDPLDAALHFPFDPVNDPALGFDDLDPTAPSEEEALAMVWNRMDRPTPWAKRAAVRLVGREIEHLPLHRAPPPIPDPRNPTLMKWVGSAVRLLFGHYETTPLHIMGLLYPSVTQSLRPEDAQTGRDLASECWKMVRYCWTREIGAHARRKAEREDTIGFLLRQVEDRWPTTPSDYEPTPEWILSRLILSSGPTRNWVLDPDTGFYDSKKLHKINLRATIKAKGLDKLIPIDRDTQAGSSVPVGPDALVQTHGFPVHGSIQGNIPDNALPPPAGMWLGGPDGSTMQKCMYSLNPNLDPSFNPQVDQWLRALAGKKEETYEGLCDWIALSLAFDRGPIAALSLNGWPGIGKDLLVRGLAECLDNPSFATGSVFGNWQYSLDSTPFVWVNEGWPSSSKRVDEQFRSLVSGGQCEIKTKYQDPTYVEHWPRLILTANTRDLVKRLYSSRDLTESDQQAISDRLFHLDLPPESKEHLASRGNFAYTSGWVHGPSGPSKYTVARHFLHLYHERGQRGGVTRFFMQNKTPPDVLRSLLFVASEEHVQIGGQVLDMVRSNQALRPAQDPESIWVSAKMVQSHQSLFGSRVLSLTQIGKVLSALAKPGSQRSITDPNTHTTLFGVWEMDPAKLVSIAHEYGHSTEGLLTNDG